MPFLHWDTTDAQERRYPENIPAQQQQSIEDRMIRDYSHGDLQMHLRRSIHAFGYETLSSSDIQKRDKLQVAARWSQKMGVRPKLLVVDQLWLWIIGRGKLGASSIPEQWIDGCRYCDYKFPRNAHSHSAASRI
jgi:hypothetical protein